MNRLVAPKEIEWLHQAVYSALDLLGVVLLDVTFGDSSKVSSEIVAGES